MAEFVQKRIEEMLPELEQMERVKLFTVDETRKMLKKRRAFEYKLQRRTREKNDYVEYIQYEIKVLDLLKIRREKTGYRFKRKDIDIAIVLRIHRLFREVCDRFPEDLDLWMYRIQFSESRNEKSYVTKVYAKLLQIHSRKPDLWILAAKYELEKTKNYETARKLFELGLQHNKESRKLWHEFFRFELLVTEWQLALKESGVSKMETDEEERISVLDERVALAIYETSLETMPGDVEFVRGFLPICRIFKFTKKLELKILEDMVSLYPEHELTWDSRARVHLHPSNGGTEESRRKLCYEVFDEAVKKIHTERMWDLYAECCIGKLVESADEENLSTVISVCTRASDNGLLSENMYMKLVDILKTAGLKEEISSALKKATEHHSTSSKIWSARLDWEIEAKKDGIEAIFEEAVTKISAKDSLPLWESMLQWASQNMPEDEVAALFERSVSTAGDAVATLTKPMYLQWTAQHRGGKAVRKLYTKLAALKPLPLKFFQTFIQIQMKEEPPKLKQLRLAHEAAISEYGSTHPEVWLDFIKMEQTVGAVDQVSQIHWRAMKNLNPSAAETFTHLHITDQQRKQEN